MKRWNNENSPNYSVSPPLSVQMRTNNHVISYFVFLSGVPCVYRQMEIVLYLPTHAQPLLLTRKVHAVCIVLYHAFSFPFP